MANLATAMPVELSDVDLRDVDGKDVLRSRMEDDVLATTLVPTISRRLTNRHDDPLDDPSSSSLTSSAGNVKATTTTGPIPLTKSKGLILIACITMSQIISTMANQSMLMALPQIGEDLAFVETDLQWIVNCYTLTYGCFLLLSGRIADILGRKRCFLAGICFFSIWTLVGGFMRNKYGFLIARALAGIGASLSVPSAIGILAENFQPGPMRTLAYACLGGGAPVGSAIGTTLGGVLTQFVSWRAIFYVLAGLALVPPFCSFWIVPDRVPSKDADRRIDFVGAGLSLAGLVLLLFVLSEGPVAPNGWSTSYIIALLVISILLIAAFIFWQYYVEFKLHRPPLMRLALFTRGKGRLGAVYAVIFFMFGGFIGFLYLADLYLQQYLLLDPLHAAIRYLPTAVSGVVCNILVGLLARILPGQYIMCIGTTGTGIANLLWAVMPSDGGSTYWTFQFFGMVLCVFGADFCMSSGMIFVAKLVEPAEQSVAGAVFQTMAQLGGSFGLTACTIVYTTITRQRAESMGFAVTAEEQASDYPKEAFFGGLSAGFYCCLAFNLAGLVIAAIALRGMGMIEDKRPKAVKEEDMVDADAVPDGQPGTIEEKQDTDTKGEVVQGDGGGVPYSGKTER